MIGALLRLNYTTQPDMGDDYDCPRHRRGQCTSRSDTKTDQESDSGRSLS